MEPQFRDGAVFVGLASVGDTELVLPTIARALGVREAENQPLDQRLADATAFTLRRGLA